MKHTVKHESKKVHGYSYAIILQFGRAKESHEAWLKDNLNAKKGYTHVKGITRLNEK